jgi:hypothetical protein
MGAAAEQKALADAARYAQEQQMELERQRMQATAEAERLQRELESEQQWHELAEAARPAVAAAWNLAQIVVILAIPVATLGALAGAGAWFWRRRHLVRPDHRGMLPVFIDDLPMAGPAALAHWHAAQLAGASVQPVPMHYSPHVNISTSSTSSAPATAAQLDQVPAPSFASFADLLSAGRIGRTSDGRLMPLLLGLDASSGAEIVGSWLDLYSTAVSGLPGSGKTTTQRYLAAQTALLGAKFVVIDPHAGAGSDSLAGTLAPLAGCYLVEPAEHDSAIIEAVRYVDSIGRRRIDGADRDMTPVILWVDELTSLMRRAAIREELAGLLEAVAQEYRKKHVFICGSGQIWTAQRTTSELRDSFASVIAHRMKRNQARLLLPVEESSHVERLATGSAVLWRTSGETVIIRVPYTTANDVERVAGMLATNGAGAEVCGMPDGSQVVVTAEASPGAPVSAEARHAADLFRSGCDMAEIVATLRGIQSSEGRRYQRALREVQALVREGL